MMKTALSVENLSKVYLRERKKNSNVNALNNITLEVKQGEIFGEVGHIIEKSRSVTAISTTNTLIKIIHEKAIKEKMNNADPVLSAIIRGLSLRIGDANDLAE